MSDRYVFSQEEGLWIDTTKTFVDNDGETLYEEIDPWATMNDQDTHLNALRAELEQARTTIANLHDEIRRLRVALHPYSDFHTYLWGRRWDSAKDMDEVCRAWKEAHE